MQFIIKKAVTQGSILNQLINVIDEILKTVKDKTMGILTSRNPKVIVAQLVYVDELILYIVQYICTVAELTLNE